MKSTAEDQYKRLVDIRLSGGNPAFVRDRGRNTDRDTQTIWKSWKWRERGITAYMRQACWWFLSLVGLIMWFNTHFTGVWSTAQRIIQRFKLIPARPAQNQPRSAFMKQSGTFWQTQDRDRIRGWQHCGEMPSQRRYTQCQSSLAKVEH